LIGHQILFKLASLGVFLLGAGCLLANSRLIGNGLMFTAAFAYAAVYLMSKSEG
jgi:drug/metabolite transporter (DMT)-like permease